MKRPLRSVARVAIVGCLGLFAACANDADPPDAGASDTGVIAADVGFADAGFADARAEDAGTNDAAPIPDGGSPDALADSGAPPGDAGEMNDAGEAPDGSTSPVCNDPYSLNGVVIGSIGASRTLLPASANPVTVNRMMEVETSIAGALSHLDTNGHVYSAQVTQQTMFDRIYFEHVVRDPVDGSIYAALQQQMQSDGLSMRFYNADGSLGRELVRNGTSGADLVGQARQSNFLLVKYDASGVVQWVSRFGPNTANTDRAGSIVSMGLTPTGVRVVARVEGATQIVFAPGTIGQFTSEAPAAVNFWAELSRASGSYAGGYRSISSSNVTQSSILGALAYSAHSAAGQTAIAGQLASNATFTVGAGGTGALDVVTMAPQALFAKLDVSGAPAFTAISEVTGTNASPQPRAVGISPNGEMVAGGQFITASNDAVFRSTTNELTLTYARDNSFLVAFSPGGAVRWVKLLQSVGRNAISRITVGTDAVYVMGVHNTGDVLGVGEPNQVTVPVPGTVVSKYDLTTGALEWIRVLDGGNALDVWLVNGRALVPAVFTQLNLRGGSMVQTLESPIAASFLAAVIFTPGGAVQSCQALATGAQLFRPF